MSEIQNPDINIGGIAKVKRTFTVEFFDRFGKYRCREIVITADTLSEEGARFWLEEQGFKKIKSVKSIAEKSAGPSRVERGVEDADGTPLVRERRRR